jgi:predicted N-acetyltransferase YhbS
MADLAILDAVQVQAVLDDTFDLWNEGLTRDAYDRYYAAQLKTAWGRTHVTRVGLVDRGVVVASAKRYLFDATLDGQAIRVAGIGAVFTKPENRRRGVARELIERLIEREAGAGADAALLFSEIGPEYYARLGFHPLSTTDLSLLVVEDPRRGAPMTLVRGGDDRDLADIAEMNRIRAEPFRFHLTRDRDLIQYAIAKKRLHAGLAAPGVRTVQFFVAEEAASAVAYVVISAREAPQQGRPTEEARRAPLQRRRTWTIEECGDRDPAGARLGAILQVLIARDPAEQRASIRAWLPSGLRPPQVEVIGEAPSRDVMMVRPLTPQGAAAQTLARDDIYYWRADLF